MKIGFLMIIPVIFWLFIVMLVIAVAKPKRRPTQFGTRNSAAGQYLKNTAGRSMPRQNTKSSFERPKMQEGLFEINLGKIAPKKEKQTIFSNTGYDDYSVIGRKKDFVTGYDKKYGKGGRMVLRSSAKQYSHTYDGHEPWDKCLPKEKDPWDKDFYA